MKAKHKAVHAPVTLPPSNVSISKVGKYRYAYHIGKGYRNHKGQPTSRRLSIGKLDDSGMLIPNENYFEIYNVAAPEHRIELDSILNFGDHFLLDSIAKSTGLSLVLENVFGSMGDEILTLAIYISLTGQALYRCEGWERETLTGRDRLMTSQRCSRVLEALDEKRRMDFFKAWAYARKQKEYLAYDVTSISSYSRGNDLVEFGYNRDREALPQVNLGMYYGSESKLPIFYCAYKGSIVDKSHLQYMMMHNERLGIKDVCFIMDRGFFSEANIKSMAFEHTFIIGMPNSLKLSKEIIAAHGRAARGSRHTIGLTGAYGIAIEDESYGFRGKIHLFYSSGKIADEERIFWAKLERWEQGLREGASINEAEDYFIISDNPNGSRNIERNHDAIDEKIHTLGYFLMMTTDLRKKPAEILDIYRSKDVIEKAFDELKNDIDLKRLRVHSEVAMEGKMFIAFIGLILKTFAHNKLKEYLDAKRPVSMAQVLDELRMIKVAKTKDGLYLRNPLTKKQRHLLERFGIDEEKIDAALGKLAGHKPFFGDDLQ